MLKSTMENICPSAGKTQEEIWKPVVGYEGFFEVSNLGRVKGLPRFIVNPRVLNPGRYLDERIIKTSKNRAGYYMVNLHVSGKPKVCTVHRLMGFAFLNLTDSLQIDHINGIKDDNRLENLRVVTCGENQRSYQKTYGVSKYRGVSAYNSQSKPWLAGIMAKGKKFNLGSFETEEEAALAYNKKAIELGFNPEALNQMRKG